MFVFLFFRPLLCSSLSIPPWRDRLTEEKSEERRSQSWRQRAGEVRAELRGGKKRGSCVLCLFQEKRDEKSEGRQRRWCLDFFFFFFSSQRQSHSECSCLCERILCVFGGINPLNWAKLEYLQRQGKRLDSLPFSPFFQQHSVVMCVGFL